MQDSQKTTLSRPYVLITPVRDEEKHIGGTIESVIAQTIKPTEWVIVSDGSTDRTNQIISEYSIQHPWIKLLALPPRTGRNFAAVVQNTLKGVSELTLQNYDYLGLLDSDVTFQPDYFEKLITHFEADLQLGLAGGVVIDVGTPKTRLPLNRSDVPGAVQFFRKTCWESLGGLHAIPGGGWDAITCASARMNGYKTRLIVDLVVDHHKPRNSAHSGGILTRRWQLGERDYGLGYHPLFELIKCAGQMRTSPLIIGAAAWWLGYCSTCIRRPARHIPRHVIKYIQSEQKARMLRLIGIGKKEQP